MRVFAVAVTLFFSLLTVSRPVSAQDRPKNELAAGYSFLHDYHVDESFPASWFASYTWNINSWLGVVGEGGGAYKSTSYSVNATTEDLTVPTTSWSTSTRLYTALFGARHQHTMGGADMFLQFLAGPAWEFGGVNVFRESVASSDPKLTIQPGAGIDVPLGGRMKARLGADYRKIFADRENADEKNNNQFRFTAGVVAGF